MSTISDADAHQENTAVVPCVAGRGINLNNAGPQQPEYGPRDTDELILRLRERAAQWVPDLFPRGRVSPDRTQWRLANIGGAPPKTSGSCKIELEGEHAGDWFDFSTEKGGDPISTIEEGTGLRGVALFDKARELANMPLRHTNGNGHARRSDEDTARVVSFTLHACVPLAGTFGQTYLNSRSLYLPPTSDLLFHSSLTDWAAKIGRPAMIAVVRRPDTGEWTGGIHCTYLAADGRGKADMVKPKMMLGPCQGGVVMLHPMAPGGLLGVGEGIETALAALKIFNIPTWAALSTSGMLSFLPGFTGWHCRFLEPEVDFLFISTSWEV
jgi:putative DNA primase/helicase